MATPDDVPVQAFAAQAPPAASASVTAALAASWRKWSAFISTDYFATAEAKASFREVLDWLFVLSADGVQWDPDRRDMALPRRAQAVWRDTILNEPLYSFIKRQVGLQLGPHLKHFPIHTNGREAGEAELSERVARWEAKRAAIFGPSEPVRPDPPTEPAGASGIRVPTPVWEATLRQLELSTQVFQLVSNQRLLARQVPPSREPAPLPAPRPPPAEARAKAACLPAPAAAPSAAAAAAAFASNPRRQPRKVVSVNELTRALAANSPVPGAKLSGKKETGERRMGRQDNGSAPAPAPAPPPLLALIQSQVLGPGDKALCVECRGSTYYADLLSDGRIRFEGKTFDAPSSWAIVAARKSNPRKLSINGWDSVKYKGKVLHEWRAEHKRRTATASSGERRLRGKRKACGERGTEGAMESWQNEPHQPSRKRQNATRGKRIQSSSPSGRAAGAGPHQPARANICVKTPRVGSGSRPGSGSGSGGAIKGLPLSFFFRINVDHTTVSKVCKAIYNKTRLVCDKDYRLARIGRPLLSSNVAMSDVVTRGMCEAGLQMIEVKNKRVRFKL